MQTNKANKFKETFIFFGDFFYFTWTSRNWLIAIVGAVSDRDQILSDGD